MLARRFLQPVTHSTLRWALPILVATFVAVTAVAAEPAKPVEMAIRASARAFVDAFNRGDAQAVAAQWTPNGTLIDDRGERFRGRSAIQTQYAQFFKTYPGARIEVTVTGVEAVSPTTAIEDGVSRVNPIGGGLPVSGRYTAIHVLDNGKWLISSVRESTVTMPEAAGRLAPLNWLVGDWEVRVDATVVRRTFRWIAQNSFLQSDYCVKRDGAVTSSGTQIIGYDPQAGQIRSWSFDSTGGHGVGHWQPTPTGWTIEWKGVTGDGARTSSRDFLIQVPGQKNIVGWRSVDRKIGDAQLPNTKEVVLDRVQAAPAAKK